MAEPDDWTARIKEELAEAARLDIEARSHRRRAGELLLKLKYGAVAFHHIIRDLGLSDRSAALLVAMAENSEPPAILPRRPRSTV